MNEAKAETDRRGQRTEGVTEKRERAIDRVGGSGYANRRIE